MHDQVSRGLRKEPFLSDPDALKLCSKAASTSPISVPQDPPPAREVDVFAKFAPCLRLTSQFLLLQLCVEKLTVLMAFIIPPVPPPPFVVRRAAGISGKVRSLAPPDLPALLGIMLQSSFAFTIA